MHNIGSIYDGVFFSVNLSGWKVFLCSISSSFTQSLSFSLSLTVVVLRVFTCVLRIVKLNGRRELSLTVKFEMSREISKAKKSWNNTNAHTPPLYSRRRRWRRWEFPRKTCVEYMVRCSFEMSVLYWMSVCVSIILCSFLRGTQITVTASSTLYTDCHSSQIYAFRRANQTEEQHEKREKNTSTIKFGCVFFMCFFCSGSFCFQTDFNFIDSIALNSHFFTWSHRYTQFVYSVHFLLFFYWVFRVIVIFCLCAFFAFCKLSCFFNVFSPLSRFSPSSRISHLLCLFPASILPTFLLWFTAKLT